MPLRVERDSGSGIRILLAVVNVKATGTVHRGLREQMDVRLKQRKEALRISAPYAHRFRQMQGFSRSRLEFVRNARID